MKVRTFIQLQKIYFTHLIFEFFKILYSCVFQYLNLIQYAVLLDTTEYYEYRPLELPYYEYQNYR